MSERLVWVFQSWLHGGMEAICQAARAAGATGLIVKSHDGNPADDPPQFRQQLLDALRLGPQYGLTVDAWGYSYGDKFGGLLAEADAAVWALKAGARRYICDAETEWEVPGSDQWVARWAQRIRSQVPGAVLGYSSFWNLRWHGAFPARAFSAVCQFTAPQVYWRDAGRTVQDAWAIALADYGPLGLPIEPVGQLTGGVTPQEIAQFLALVGPRNVSWWLADGAPEALLQAACAQPVSVGASGGGGRPLASGGSPAPSPSGSPAPTSSSPTPSPSQGGPSMFPDIQGPEWAWAARDIEWLAQLGIIHGAPDGLFHPGDPLNRAEAAVMLARLLRLLSAGQQPAGGGGGPMRRTA